ncbi:MAG TPA: hypothetical protein VIV12_02840 [Streptosporangiaceae bacterium]
MWHWHESRRPGTAASSWLTLLLRFTDIDGHRFNAFLLRRWLPPAAFDAFVRTQFPIPHPQAGPGPSRPQRAPT